MLSMWRGTAHLPGQPEEILALLTDPYEIARWSPVGFELVECTGERLCSGSRARVRGELAGRRMEFTIAVHEASHDRLALVASGPINLDVEYRVAPTACGSHVRAAVGVSGQGFIGRLIARAAEALLAAGALDHALSRIGRQLQPTTAPALAA